MKKLFKKIATVVAAVAMVTAMTTTAFAADPAVRVAGAEGLTGVNWDPATSPEMTAKGDGTYEITFENIKAGDYGFKVIKGDAWGDAYNLEGTANGMGDDAQVKVEKDGSTVVIKFDGTKASVEVKEAAADKAPAADEKPADKAPVTGDATAVVAMVVVAAVAGALVVASRRQTANN